MVILVEKLGRSLKLGRRLEKQESQEALRACFQAFGSDTSQALAHILGDGKAGGSLAWIQRCLENFPAMEKAFAKLAVSIDYPMAKWGASVSEAYLNYCLDALELLNKMSSSLSHLSQARLCLSHELASNSDSMHLHRIKPKDIGNSFINLSKPKARLSSLSHLSEACSRESIIHEALAIMSSAGLQLFGVMLSALCGDPWPYFEVRKSAGDPPPLQGIEFLDMEQTGLQEVEEVNDAAATKGDSGAAQILLPRKLEILEKALQATGKQADALFSRLLAARTSFLDTIRLK